MKYSLRYYLIVPFILLLQIACSNHDPNTLTGRHFEIDYFQADTFKSNHWIQIDSTRFTHHRWAKNMVADSFGVPATEVIQDSLDPEQKMVADYNPITIAIMVGNKLSTIGKQDSINGRRYLVSNKPVLLTYGKLRFHRRDSSQITITTSDNYPAKVKELELE